MLPTNCFYVRNVFYGGETACKELIGESWEGAWGGIKEFHISHSEKVSPNQQTEYSLGKMCLISDQGCGSVVRVVLREFLAQSETREDHNYYGSLFF